MKIVKYEKDKEDKDKTIRVKLVQKGDTVKLIAVDVKGDMMHRGYLAEILSDGTILMNEYVSKDIGFSKCPLCASKLYPTNKLIEIKTTEEITVTDYESQYPYKKKETLYTKLKKEENLRYLEELDRQFYPNKGN